MAQLFKATIASSAISAHIYEFRRRMSRIARILITSDVHSKVDNVYRLALCLQQRRLKPDMIILCGDLVNTNHDYESLSSSLRSSGTTATSGGSSDISQSFRDAADTLARMRIQQEENEFRSILQGLGGISKSVFYIPGNHDPAEAFPDLHPAIKLPSDQPTEESTSAVSPLWQRMQATTGAINFHRRLLRLAPNLIMGGFGGSVPQTLYSDPSRVAHTGYPYTELDLSRGVNDLLRKKRYMLSDIQDVLRDKSRVIPPNSDPDAHILVTHCGPAGVGTTDINKTPFEAATTRLESGSRELNTLLSSPYYQGTEQIPPTNQLGQNRTRSLGTSYQSKETISSILFHVHGHSHSAWGISHLGKIPIINPGPLRDGRFAIVTIRHGLGVGLVQQWILDGVEFGSVL